jgi:hypothetical protein
LPGYLDPIQRGVQRNYGNERVEGACRDLASLRLSGQFRGGDNTRSIRDGKGFANFDFLNPTSKIGTTDWKKAGCAFSG